MASDHLSAATQKDIDALRALMLELADDVCASRIVPNTDGARLLIAPSASHGDLDVPPATQAGSADDIRHGHHPLLISASEGRWIIDFEQGTPGGQASFPYRNEALDFIQAWIEGYWRDHHAESRSDGAGSPLRNVYLDDERRTPEGWVRVYWPAEAIALLDTGIVAEISLDHDLGDDARGTGYDVIAWIEEAVATRHFVPPVIRVHSANPAARVRMEAGIAAIERLHARNAGAVPAAG